MTRIRRVYVAGRFTAPSRWEEEKNVREAESVGYRVASVGAYPVIPHSSTRHYFIGVRPPEFWYEATMAEMRTCDAVVMVPGWTQSVGAVAEKSEAERLGIPVFIHVRDLVTWLAQQTD